MDKNQIAGILNQIGMLLEIKGENFFKCKAYYDGARAIELMEEEPEVLVKENRLRGMKGFGEALSSKITELVTTGRLLYYEKLKSEIPSGLLEMAGIQGMGPKKIKAVYDNLGITTIDELKSACLEDRIARLPGFGAKSQAKILEGIENLGKYTGQYLFPVAMELASSIVDSLKESGLVIRCSEGGSLRRRKETVKDIDILASSIDSSAVMDYFTNLPFVTRINSKGDTKSSATLINGINADLRVVDDSQYPYALHHFTGSKEHNTALRHLAKQQDIKMNEYGLFSGENEELIKCRNEEEIFSVFGMQYIPPELRENNGELEAAKQGSIPELIKNEDIQGVFHVHTAYSDGLNTIEDIVKACILRGYKYLGISDHSLSAYFAGGLKHDDIKRQHEEIDILNGKYPGFRIFKGIEIEILSNGDIDYDENTLSLFDFTIASVHSQFNLDEDKMTERVIKAMKNKYVTILGHPSGRLLLSREPFRINMNEIIKTASTEKVIIEINASPNRLDLDWRFCKAAKEEGCMFVISPDAHRLAGLDDMAYGVNTARKGWLCASDVVNSRTAAEVNDMLTRSV